MPSLCIDLAPICTIRSFQQLGYEAAGDIEALGSNVVAEVLRLTNGKGARVVFDPVGGPTFQRLAQATAVGGILFIYGALSPETTPLPALAAIGRHLTIRGYQVVEVIDSEEKVEDMKRFIVEGLASGALRPKIAKIFPFEQIVEAHRYLESNTQVGKVVVVL